MTHPQVAHFRRQAQACADLGSPMYADLIGRLADDLAADPTSGPTASVLRGHEHDSGPSALALRLTGSVHRLALQRRAGSLATFYPSVGGTWEAEGCWAAWRGLLADDPEAAREWLDRPPQTNEVGRSAALYGGLLHLGAEHRLPVRLFEIGSSGGLNLLGDRFAYVASDGEVRGEPGSPVRLDGAWSGPVPPAWPDLAVVERSGSDVLPVDVATTEGRLTLTAYVWPDQTHRHERLRGALALAAETPVQVVEASAGAFVGGLGLVAGTTTVLWHSVMWQYLDRDEQAEVEATIAALGAAATPEAPFVHLFLEPTRRTPGAPHEFLVVLTSWPSGRRRVLGTSVGHGVPTSWEG